MQPTRYLILVAVFVSACGAPQRKTMTHRSQKFEETSTLSVGAEETPSRGGEFTFCATPAPDDKLNLGNAAWLAFLANAEYAHLHYLAKVLRGLGFKSPDGDGFDWPTCSVDLRVMRGFEKARAKQLSEAHAKGKDAMRTYLEPFAKASGEDAWGDCAKRWFASSGYDGENYPAPSFEKYLVQTHHPGEFLQFFSGGEFVMEGRAFTEGSTQMFFARHQEKPVVIISFRGTEANKWRDIATDGKSWKTKLSKHGWPKEWGSVHAGFFGAFDSIGEVMGKKLEEYRDQEIGIWVTGHSLGGALATLMGAEILRRIDAGENYKLKGIYTFGSPRVGNNAFHDKFTKAAAASETRVVRFRNGDDIVTAVPGLLLEYKHVGTLAHLSEEALELPEKDPDYAGVGSVGDHNMSGWDAKKKAVTGYYRRIRKRLAALKPGAPFSTCPAN